MKTEIKITKHAKKRFKQRTGLPKKIISKKVRTAFINGLSMDNVKGSMKKYLKDIIKRYPEVNNIRIESGYVWVFIGVTLITLYPLPGSLSKYVLN